MTNLPKAIETYFTTAANDSQAASLCFSTNAVVHDEGNTYTGRDAIKQWIQDSNAKYSFKSEPYGYEEVEGKSIVTSKVTGTFPGSPIDLRYAFQLEANEITFLEIGV